MQFKKFLFLVICLFPILTNAADLPKELLYKGKSIDPICLEFFGDSSRFDPVDLSSCNPAKSLPGFKVTNWKAPEGFYGYEYTYNNAFNITYSYYRYLGKIDNLMVIHNMMAFGGTGRFLSINFVERKDNTIRLVKDGPGGDRANGVKEARVEDNKLFYSIGLTSLDVVSLVDKDFSKDSCILECCAICLKAIAHYCNDDLQYVEFAKDYAILDDLLNASSQQCFNKIYNEYVKEEKTKLNQEQLKAFVKRFKKECLSSK